MDQAAELRKLMQQKNEDLFNARVIAITSGKGGVGKSSISVNLAVQLQKRGNRVIILDADFGLANIEVMLGMRPKYTIADMLLQQKQAKDIIEWGPLGIGFLSGGSGIKQLVDLGKGELHSLIQKLSSIDDFADVIIIDTGAGISDTVLEFLIASPEVILVTTPEPTSLTDAYAVLKTLNKNEDFNPNSKKIRIVANRVSSVKEGNEIYVKLNTVVQKFLEIQTEFLGLIPQDNNASRAIIQQKPISICYPHSPAAKAYVEISEALYHIEGKKQNKLGISNLFSSLLRMRK